MRSSRFTNQLFLLAVAGSLIGFCVSCDTDPLTNSFRSSDALVNAVLDALERQDRDALESLLVTSEEHRTLLWEQLPESNDLTFNYARQLNERNSGKAITEAISSFGGTRYEFVSLDFAETAEAYDGFTLHMGARLTVRRVSDGAEGTLPILDVFLEYGGRWKLMNYDE
jgi:hypothetical protein